MVDVVSVILPGLSGVPATRPENKDGCPPLENEPSAEPTATLCLSSPSCSVSPRPPLDVDRGLRRRQRQRERRRQRRQQLLLVVFVTRPRILFYVLQPRLFESPKSVARSALSVLVNLALPHDCDGRGRTRTRRKKGTTASIDVAAALVPTNTSSCLAWSGATVCLAKRRLACRFGRRLFRFAQVEMCLLQPSVVTTHEQAWEGRVLHWENQLLRAQTVAGFLSTLGGAYFMCHHLSSAVVLAQYQQRMAQFLSDSSMFYKCLVNQAYNVVYAGRFRSAMKLLRTIEQSVVLERPMDRDVLLQMCAAARLFARRVQKASLTLPKQPTSKRCTPDAASSTGSSAVVDDYARIRVVQDASTLRDLTVPFARR